LAEDFAGKGGYIPVDAVRFSGWQDWTADGNNGWGLVQLSKAEPTYVWQETIDATGLAVLELDYRFRAETVCPGDELLVEYRTANGWETARTHAYDYALVAGQTYSGRVVFRAGEHDLTDSFRLRFRCTGQTTGKLVGLDDLWLRSRQAVLSQ
jgi:hypothetical protein